MNRPTDKFARVVRGTVLGSVPIGLTFILLGALGHISAGPAAVAWAGLSAVFAITVWIFVSDLVGVLTLAEQDRHADEQEQTPSARTNIGRELSLAVQRLDKTATRRLKRRERDFDGLEGALDALPGPLLQLTNERQIVRANRAAEKMFGGNLEDRDLAGVMRSPSLLAALSRAVEERVGQDMQFVLPAPIERSFAARVEPLSKPARDGTALVLALVDLTSIQRADQMRVDFVANASHEIRTPLATLIGFIETLRGPAKDDAEAREKFLTIMESHAQRMARLVDDLLSLSRIEMNEHTPPSGEADLAGIIEAVRDQLEWQAKKRDVTVELDIKAEARAVLGDADELTQLFQNLVSNAIKYGDQGSTVTVHAEAVVDAPGTVGWRLADHGAIAISIQDQGDGIPREHLPRLTERFYRVDTARSRELGGTGLGLAIVKHIVSRHRGALNIDSEAGVGSTFTVYLQPAQNQTTGT